MTPITTNILREHYERNEYSFGNPKSFYTICIVGSCRIVPILNYFRAYNGLNGNPFELVCFNPVEMWKGLGTDIADCTAERLKDFRFSHVDTLICESLKHCGPLNTFEDEPQNVFTSLNCNAETVLRIPNWHGMLFYDIDIKQYNNEYATLSHNDRISMLKTMTALYKTKFLTRCDKSSFPELRQWTEKNWLTTRMGWTSEHVCRNLTWKYFELICNNMGLTITHELAEHPLCIMDPYAATGAVVSDLDREANNWKY